MVLLNQNGEEIANIESYYFLDGVLYFRPAIKHKVIFGSYKSKEIAEKVFLEIIMSLENGEKTYQMPRE